MAQSPYRVAGTTLALLMAALAFGHATSQFLRNSVGVIAPDLAAELGLNAGEIGLLSSAFFFTFALSQIPVGIAIDRYGPRATMIVSMMFAVIGCVVFATAHSPIHLIVARAIIGIGCSSLLMAPLAVISSWFARSSISTMVGLLLAFGNLGTVFTSAPFSWVIEKIGWRGGFLGVAAATALAALLILVVIRDQPPGAPSHSGNMTLRGAVFGMRDVVRTPSFVPLFAINLANYAVFATIFGVWAGPWLADVYGIGLVERGQMLMILALSQALTFAVWGPLDRVFGSYKVPILTGTVFNLSLLAIVIVRPDMPVGWIGFWFAGIGAASSYSSLIQAHGRSLFPDHLAGRGVTLLNFGTMTGVFLQQAITGAVIARYPAELVDGRLVYPAEAYRAAYAVLAVTLAVAALIYSRARDPAAEARRAGATKG